MFNNVFYYTLDLVLGNYLVDTLGKGCQNLTYIFLFGFEIFYEGAVEGEKN